MNRKQMVCKKRGYHDFTGPYESGGFEESSFETTCDTCGMSIECSGEWE